MPNPDDLADDAALAEFSRLLQALLDWRKTIDLQIDGRTIMRTTVDFVTLTRPPPTPAPSCIIRDGSRAKKIWTGWRRPWTRHDGASAEPTRAGPPTHPHPPHRQPTSAEPVRSGLPTRPGRCGWTASATRTAISGRPHHAHACRRQRPARGKARSAIAGGCPTTPR